MKTCSRFVIATCFLWTMALMSSDDAFAQAPKFEPEKTVKISAGDRSRLEAALKELDTAFGRLHDPIQRVGKPEYPPGWADAEIGRKALRWILKYDEFYDAKFVAMTDRVIAATRERIKTLDEPPAVRPGFGRVFAYVATTDGSVQPYAAYVPADFDPKKPQNVLVVLHGRNQKLNEVSFFDAHEGKPYPKSEIENGMNRVVLHVFGRTNNAYRWSGEHDVFEAIRAYGGLVREMTWKIESLDLQGFSMGGAGAWHLGLNRPLHWRTVEAGAGFDESRKYARLKNLKPWEEKLLTIYDSYLLARNVVNVPTIGYGGELDPQLQASTNILDQLTKEGFALKTEGLETTVEGVDFLRLVGAGQGHMVDPASRKRMDTFVRTIADRGPEAFEKRFRHIDQVFYTIRWPYFGWIFVNEMQNLYERGWIQANLSEDGMTAEITRMENVRSFAITSGDIRRPRVRTLKFDGKTYDLDKNGLHLFVFENGSWRFLTGKDQEARFLHGNGKNCDLSGPIDDAFADRGFVVVGPEGEGAGPQRKAMETFASNWSKYLRGDLPIVKAEETTFLDGDGGDSKLKPYHHLVLFGDAKTNPLIAKILPRLPQIRWTETEFTLGGKTYSTKDHYPALIAPNPLQPNKYVVINSGHTFGKRDFEGTNALLYPRMGDWGVLKVKDDGTTEIVDSGFFDANWMPQ